MLLFAANHLEQHLTTTLAEIVISNGYSHNEEYLEFYKATSSSWYDTRIESSYTIQPTMAISGESTYEEVEEVVVLAVKRCNNKLILAPHLTAEVIQTVSE